MTHAELVKVAERWLRRKGHVVVLSDVRCNHVREQPDAIGWKNSGLSSLVECKVTLKDARGDSSKPFRTPEGGMGHWRWMMVTPEIAGASFTLLPNWGLAVAETDGLVHVLKRVRPFATWNIESENTLLVRAVRSVTEGWGRRMFGDIAPPLVDGDPHPTATKIIRELRVENERLKGQLSRTSLGIAGSAR